MIPNFNPNKWNREKIIDYVIGDEPLDDQQLAFLNYIEQLQQENKELKDQIKLFKEDLAKAEKICQKYNNKYYNIKLILIGFEKWIEEKIKQAKELDSKEYHDEINLIIKTYKFVLIKLQELKEGK